MPRYVPPVVKCEKSVRCTPDGLGGFTSVEEVKLVIVSQGRFEMQTERKLVAEGGSRMVFETLQDKPGYFIERIENVLVKPGMYRTVQDRMLVKAAHRELITETVEIKPGRLELVEAGRFTICAVADRQACVFTVLIAINIAAAGSVLAVCEMMNSVETLNVSAQRS